jgi:transketolase
VPDVILISSGSEVSLCLSARDLLAAEYIKARVVSLPSWELFDEQDHAYQQSVLPPAVKARVTVEEGPQIGWERFAGPCGVTLGMRSFGMSAPMQIVAEYFGFKAEHVAAAAKTAIRRAAGRASSEDEQLSS